MSSVDTLVDKSPMKFLTRLQLLTLHNLILVDTLTSGQSYIGCPLTKATTPNIPIIFNTLILVDTCPLIGNNLSSGQPPAL
jgi:hypothetical protein